MADMTFMLKFIADNAAAMKTIKDMQNASKAGETGKQAADAAKVENSMKKAAEAGKASANAAKEAQAATKGAASEAAKAELSVRRRAATERAANAEARRARTQEVEAMREQARAATAERAAKAQAAREARLAQLEQRRAAQAEWAAQQNARRSAEQDEIRRAEKIAASMRRRGSTITAQDIIDGQRRAGQAAEQAGQKAAQAESRWRRLGQAMRNISWGRIGSTAGAEMAKGIAKGVADAVTAGVRQGASNAGGIFRQGLMGGGGGGGGAVGLVSGAVRHGVALNQSGMTAANQMRSDLGPERAQQAVAAAEAASAASGNLISRADNYAAAIALSKSGVVADAGFLAQLGDTAVANKTTVAQLAENYAAALREKDMSRFTYGLGGTVTAGDNGGQTLSYFRDGQPFSRVVGPGDEAGLVATLREFMARDQGAASRMRATPEGILKVAQTQMEANLATSMAEPFKVVTEWLTKFNAAMTTEGGAAGSKAEQIGKQIADAMRNAGNEVERIGTSVKTMVEPLDRTVQLFGGWKMAAGGLVAIGVAAWLGNIAAGIKNLAVASAVLAASPAGKLLGLGAAAYVAGTQLGDLAGQLAPEHQAKSQADLQRLWTWLKGERRLGEDAAPKPMPMPAPAPSTAPAAAASADKQAQVTATAEQTALALATIEAVVPAARAMVAEVGSILSAANFHSHGVAMMQTLAAGIRAGSAAAVGAVRETTQAMRDHLPHSPAKTGPLSDLDRIRFSETLASAIRPGPAIAAVNAVAAGMRAAIPMGLTAGIGLGGISAAAADTPPPVSTRGAGGGMSLVYAPTITLPAGADRADFARLLDEHKTQIAEIVERAAARRSDLKFE